MLTQKRLKALLEYSPEMGLFYWLVERGGSKIGDKAGNVRQNGYIIIGIDLQLYRAHQLVWLYMTGEWPPQFIDHINLNKSDNRWTNLRLATKSQNMANCPPPKHNTSGLKGASRYRAGETYGKGWQATIQKDGKTRYIGRFATAEEAHAAYVIAAQKFFGEFARAQ